MQNKFFTPKYLLLLLLLLGFIVRLYRFNGPIADWHSWRQADTSAVSRYFVQNGFDILHPHFEDLSNIPSGMENPQGYRFVEFPIYNIAQAGLSKFIGVLTLEEWGRLVTIFSSLATALFLYLIVKKHTGVAAGLFTALFFLFIPYNIYYDRTILPDVSMAMAITGGIYFFDKWLDKKDLRFKIYDLRFIFALLFTACAFLLKPYALIFTLPMVCLVFEKFGFNFWKKWQLYMFAFIAVVPLVWWRVWIKQFPEGIPASSWLLNGNGIRFRPAFFGWILQDRIARLICGYAGTLLLVVGLWSMVKKKSWFYLSFLLASLLYVCIFATGNVQHDYYQILIVPSLCIALGIGANYLYTMKKKGGIAFGKLAVICLILASFYIGWFGIPGMGATDVYIKGVPVFGNHPVKDYFNINNPSIVIAGKVVDQMTPKNAKVIANLEGDTSFLYQTNRAGWPSYEHDMPEMIKLGADYLVLANPTTADLAFGKTYKIVSQTPQYVLFNLKQKP